MPAVGARSPVETLSAPSSGGGRDGCTAYRPLGGNAMPPSPSDLAYRKKGRDDGAARSAVRRRRRIGEDERYGMGRECPSNCLISLVICKTVERQGLGPQPRESAAISPSRRVDSAWSGPGAADASQIARFPRYLLGSLHRRT